MQNIFNSFLLFITTIFSGGNSLVPSASTTTIYFQENIEVNDVIDTRITDNRIEVSAPRIIATPTAISKLLDEVSVEYKINNKKVIEIKENLNVNNVGGKVYSESELLNLAGPKLKTLPLGDNQYTTTAPKVGYIFLCNARADKIGGGAEPCPRKPFLC